MRPKEYYYTDEDITIAESNGITAKAFRQRLARGIPLEEARTAPMMTRRVYDRDLVREAEDNGIPAHVFYERKRRGWSDARASTTPVARKRRDGVIKMQKRRYPIGWTPDDPLEDWEVVAIVARIKWMNENETREFPITVPEPLMLRLKQMGLTYEKLIPMEVEDDGETG